MQRITISTLIVWAILALPAIPMMAGLISDPSNVERLLHPSGEFAARFMIIAMLITPLRLLFPRANWLMWLARRRRWIGVAAFFYAALHTLLYIVDIGSLQKILDDFWALGIWTGWAAFAIFIPLAVTSNDASQRWLRARWKSLQRWVYPAAILTLAHWIFVHNEFGPALVHFIPLAGLETYRIWKNLTTPQTASAR